MASFAFGTWDFAQLEVWVKLLHDLVIGPSGNILKSLQVSWMW
jgi:hypothetical protein